MRNRETHKYIVRETLTSMAINGVLSFSFAWLVFHDSPLVPRNDLVADAIPQSFMVSLFSVFVPTILARRMLRAQKLLPLPSRPTSLPNSAFLRAIVIAFPVAMAGALVHWLFLHGFQIEKLSTSAVLFYKPVYGALVALLVTPLGLCIALTDAVGSPGSA